MNNTINTSYNNTSFNGRYLVIPENYERHILFPQKVKEVIYKNEAIRSFISDGNPKAPRTFWQKIKDAFQRDEVLEVAYDTCISAWGDSITFRFGEKGSKKVRTYQICVDDNDRKAITGYSDTTNMNKYETRRDLFIELFAKKIEEIKDFESLLSRQITTLTKPL